MKSIKSNLVVLCSFMFFLITNAFTFAPQENSLNGCYTCDTATGNDHKCTSANFCGMTACSSTEPDRPVIWKESCVIQTVVVVKHIKDRRKNLLVIFTP